MRPTVYVLAPLFALMIAACAPRPAGTAVPPQSSSSARIGTSIGTGVSDIRSLSVSENDTLTSGMTVTGEARGTYFFEASFPVLLTDSTGTVIANAVAQADGEWITEDFVPFSFVLNFTTNASEGMLILKNDNPSGDPVRDKQLSISVKL